MFVSREDSGVWLRDMPMWVVDTLQSLPGWIESDNPAVRARLHPKAYEDEEKDREWRDALGASLEHLVAQRTEIVRSDLSNLQMVTLDADEVAAMNAEAAAEAEENGEDPSPFRPFPPTVFDVWIPGEHVSAWVSTLQAGTHAVFILEGLTPEDIDQESEADVDPEKQLSLVRLSILQEILIHLLDE